MGIDRTAGGVLKVVILDQDVPDIVRCRQVGVARAGRDIVPALGEEVVVPNGDPIAVVADTDAVPVPCLEDVVEDAVLDEHVGAGIDPDAGIADIMDLDVSDLEVLEIAPVDHGGCGLDAGSFDHHAGKGHAAHGRRCGPCLVDVKDVLCRALAVEDRSGLSKHRHGFGDADWTVDLVCSLGEVDGRACGDRIEQRLECGRVVGHAVSLQSPELGVHRSRGNCASRDGPCVGCRLH